jgi:SAM-dependent methyltransferase
MSISTIVLNWNRADLLRATLQSYVETALPPFDITVLDNASDDHSREVIEEARRVIPGLRAVYAAENLGGEALNELIAAAAGDLIHVHENDLLLFPGWQEYAWEAFRAFPDLGQLSLFCGVPPDEYPGEPQPATLRFAQGKIVYEAHRNVGTSCLLRPELVRRGLRVHNIPVEGSSGFRFPDDGRLSRDVRTEGYWCAFSDRHYLRNVGHELDEFARDPSYYERNYAAKPEHARESWRERVAAAADAPRPARYSAAIPSAQAQPVRTPGSCGAVPARLWSMLDARTPETEVLDAVHAFVRLTKPRRALDTSSWLGYTAIAIGSALRDNGFGTACTVQRDAEAAPYALERIAAAGLAPIVSMQAEPPQVPSESFDFAFFAEGMHDEAMRLYDLLEDGTIVVFHGLGAAQGPSPSALDVLVAGGLVTGIAISTPRGLFLGRLAKPQEGLLPRLPSGFDARRYLAENPDVARAAVDPAEHFRRFGWREGRRYATLDPADDDYGSWAATYRHGADWEAMYASGRWAYLDGLGELPHYALAAGYVHKLMAPGTVLDAGCGEAIFRDYLDGARFRYHGFDISQTAIANAHEHLQAGDELSVAAMETFDPPVGRRYAAVVFNESLQYTPIPLESLDRFRGYLVPGGVMVVSLYRRDDPGANGPRLARFLEQECRRRRFALVDRARAVSLSHERSWDIFVLR